MEDWINLETLREMPFCYEIAVQRNDFIKKLHSVISNWKGQLPNLRDTFAREEIEWLLGLLNDDLRRTDMKNQVIEFVVATGYKDEPELDNSGKPVLRRTTPVHSAYDGAMLRNLFKIYDRFDANYTDAYGFTHFHQACRFGCVDVVKKFLELGQEPNCLAQKPSASPLHLALRNNGPNNEIVQLLLRNGADPNATDERGWTPLHVVCTRENAHDWVKMIFELSAYRYRPLRVNARTNLGSTPLHMTLTNWDDNPETMELLLMNGADPNLSDVWGSTPLHLICRYSKTDEYQEIFFRCIDDYVQLPLSVDARDKPMGRTALHYALTRDRKERTVRELLRRGADPNVADEAGKTPLHDCHRGDLDQLEAFFETCRELGREVRIDARDKQGRTPLQSAVANLSPDTVHLLLVNGANLAQGFVFPETFERRQLGRDIDRKLRLTADVLDIVEILKERGYELNRSDALKVMKLLVGMRLFENSADPEEYLWDYEEFVEESENAKALLQYKEAWRKFFRSSARDSILELTRYELSIRSCEMIIEQLSNQDLYNICLATVDQNS